MFACMSLQRPPFVVYHKCCISFSWSLPLIRFFILSLSPSPNYEPVPLCSVFAATLCICGVDMEEGFPVAANSCGLTAERSEIEVRNTFIDSSRCFRGFLKEECQKCLDLAALSALLHMKIVFWNWSLKVCSSFFSFLFILLFQEMPPLRIYPQSPMCGIGLATQSSVHSICVSYLPVQSHINTDKDTDLNCFSSLTLFYDVNFKL